MIPLPDKNKDIVIEKISLLVLKDPYNWLNEGGVIKKTKLFSDTSCGNFLLNQEVKLKGSPDENEYL